MIPDGNEELHTKVNGLLISFAQHFEIVLDILSNPYEFLVLRDSVVFITSVSVMVIIFISVVLSEEASFCNCKALLNDVII
jgi:hypothetical protein